MKRAIVTLIAVLIPVLPAHLWAGEVESAFLISGGTGVYSYRVHPDVRSVVSHEVLSRPFPVEGSLRMLSDFEAYSPSLIDGRQKIGRLAVQFLLDDISMGVGMNHFSYRETCIENCGAFRKLLLLQHMDMNGAVLTALEPRLIEPEAKVFSHTGFDIDLGYHLFSRRSWVNPYAGLVIGFGICSFSSVGKTSSGCYRAGAFYGLRLRMVDSFFFFVQNGWDRVLPTGGPERDQYSRPVPSQVVFGIGLITS